MLPVPSPLLRVWGGSHEKAQLDESALAYPQAHCKMPSLASRRQRSRSLTFERRLLSTFSVFLLPAWAVPRDKTAAKNGCDCEKTNDAFHKTPMLRQIGKLVFDGVGLTAKFLSSLMPCLSAMVIRSRQKFCSCLLVKFPIFQFVWVKPVLSIFFCGSDIQR